jgi:hypothetical protein
MRSPAALIILLLSYSAVMAARSNDWPVVFAVPEKGDTAADSGKVRLSADAKVFEGAERTNNRLDWSPVFSSWQLRQRLVLSTSHEWPNATNQQYDFSGSVMRDSVLPHNGSLGFEWIPVSYLNLRDSGGGFQTKEDFGPVMKWKVREIPVRLKGGISGSGWNNNLSPHLFDSRYDDFHGDAGFYGAFSAGDPTIRFFGRPLYITTEAFVRSVSKVGIAVINASALLAREFGRGDSLFAYYGDSLSNGKERYWGSTGAGQQQYLNTPWRIARSLQASGGLKFKERRRILPALVYSYMENSVTYPNLAGKPSDVRTRLHSLNLLAETRSALPVVYKGGIKIWWGAEEWLYKSDLSAVAKNFHMTGTRKDTLTRDSLNVKLGDHQIYRAATDHQIAVTLPRGISLAYTLSIFRDSKTFGPGYSDIRNNYDQDAVTLNHHVGLQFPRFHGLDAEVYGEYSVYTLNYIKKEQSRANQVEDGYCLGLNMVFKPMERFTLSERIRADAEIFDYIYKRNHIGDPPPYRRKFSSLCMGVWKISKRWELNGRWDEDYNDDGIWNGHEYFNAARPDSLGTDYYAIIDKSTRYSVELGLALNGKKFRVESGCRFEDIFNRSFADSSYVSTDAGIGYKVEPYTEFSLSFHWLSLKGRIARLINTLAPDKWMLRKNWDMHITGQAVW